MSVVCVSLQNEEQASSVKQALNSLLFSFLVLDSDGAHDGDDVGGRTGGV